MWKCETKNLYYFQEPSIRSDVFIVILEHVSYVF